MFHTRVSDLHQHVSPEVLPTELGGEAGPMNYADCQEGVTRFEDYFRCIQKLGEDNKGRF